MANSLGYNGGRFYSDLVKPVLIDCNFVVDAANGNGLGIRNLKGSLVRNVFMHTSASAGVGANNVLNPNPPVGYVLIQLKSGYSRYAGGFSGFVSPTTGGTIAINGTALTTHNPYVIASVGVGPAGAATIAPVADVSKSLASTWFSLFDSYGNVFVIWFSVSGTGAAPKGVSGTLVQQSITTGDTAATIGGLLATTIANLPSGISGVFSFTATGTTTVTVTSTASAPLAGPPAEGVIPTGFTFALTKFNTNAACWAGVGLPRGIVPSVGASFIATSTGVSAGGGSSGLVVIPSVSGVTNFEVVGDPNATLYPSPAGGSILPGGWLMVQCLGATDASTTTLIPKAPADNSVLGMQFLVEQSSVLISGI